MRVKFEWDPAKAVSNLRKHGVSFEIAIRVFADPFALSEPDRIEGGEQRWQTLGLVEGMSSCWWPTHSGKKRRRAARPWR
jgi:uncharacterized DUF497 family protein